MKSILDRTFVYVPASRHATSEYLRAKFRRIRRELDAQAKADAEAKVTPMRKKAAK